MTSPFWRTYPGSGPLIATAIHDGHELREEVAALMQLDEASRLREEDPFTGAWTVLAPTRIIVRRSRFEADLNRPRERAVYRRPEDAWGLEIWRGELPEEVARRSLEEYDAFYRELQGILAEMEARHGRFVLLDLHSYNHRRGGPGSPPADEGENPQVNVGTGTLDRPAWVGLVDRFLDDLRAYDYPGSPLDVRENVKFRGGHLSRWVHETFPRTGCALAVEFKKFFMDEWTGEPDQGQVSAIGDALAATVPGILEELTRR